MGDRSDTIDQIRKYLTKHLPTATSLLELGCGTGALLAGFAGHLSLTGIDQSPEMLAFAAKRVPDATLVPGDMTRFSLGQRFDVVICMFDTLNHVPRFEDWTEVFKRAHEHLVEGGLFIFDVNTIGRLRGLGRQHPYVEEFGGNTLIMDITPTDTEVFIWEVKIFEHLQEDVFRLHHETILQLGVPLAQIRAALEPYFDVLEEDDQDGHLVGDEAERIFFACRARG
ncbi:MAG TPA: methyltransferase domain-containing protein [Streptosporangiaceae bacterium]|nr:methyltransferase domain-containing protein [Streptosporangiaceae bacterium]